MKTITICGKEYPIECNALTYVQYKNVFKTGIIKDMQILKNYLIRQTIVSKEAEDKNISDVEKISFVSNYMNEYIDDFIATVTKMAWILIYTADDKVTDYETWLKSIRTMKIDDDWIVEVTEFAVDCFC